LHIKYRDPALKKIHREDVEHEQKEYSGYNDVADNFENNVFDEIVDDDYSENNQTDKKIADEIAEIVREYFWWIHSLKQFSIWWNKYDLFDKQKQKRE